MDRKTLFQHLQYHLTMITDVICEMAGVGKWIKDSTDTDIDSIEDMYNTLVLNRQAVFDKTQ
jgi:hypothetical protein